MTDDPEALTRGDPDVLQLEGKVPMVREIRGPVRLGVGVG
jgi:hypothetical protein